MLKRTTLAGKINHAFDCSKTLIGRSAVRKCATHMSSTDEEDNDLPTVGVVAPFPYPIDRGSPLRAQSLLEATPDEFEIHVFTYHLGDSSKAERPIHRIHSLPFDFYDAGASYEKAVCDVFLLNLVRKSISEYDIDILHGHLHEGCVTSLLATKLHSERIPVVFDSHGALVAEMIDTGFIDENSLQRPIWERVESWAEQSADRIIANSPARRNDLLSRGVSEENVTTIPDCIDTDVFAPAEPDQDLANQFGLDLSEPIVVYTGSLHDFQGIDDLLDATEQLTADWPDLQLLLVGGGEIKKYEQQASRLGIENHVTFAGSQPFDLMPQFINLGDIGVVPRKPHRENLPLKMLTYMSAALPTVVADVASVEEVISPNRDAILYEAGEADSLADGCENLLSDTDYRGSVGQEARKKICQEYSYEAAGEKIRSEYMRLAQRSG